MSLEIPEKLCHLPVPLYFCLLIHSLEQNRLVSVFPDLPVAITGLCAASAGYVFETGDPRLRKGGG